MPDPGLSVHLAVMTTLSLPKPPHQTKVIRFCKIQATDPQKFTHDIASSPILVTPPNTLAELISIYNKSLEHVLNTHAPVRSATIRVRHDC